MCKPVLPDRPAALLLDARVMHARKLPRLHRFVYPVFCLRLNLARLEECNGWLFGVDKPRLLSLQRRDYGARDGSDLQHWMRGVLATHGLQADGEIWLQTFPRIAGFVFNPVSFWYCHAADGSLRAVLAEVNSTFGEHLAYLLHAGGEAIDHKTSLHCHKQMHVSPFCRQDGLYRFRFSESRSHGAVNIHYQQPDAPQVTLQASLSGRKLAFSQMALLRQLLRKPLQSIAVVARIHWQALLLWGKRVPWFSHRPKQVQTWVSANARPDTLQTPHQ